MYLKMIACDILHRECCQIIANSVNKIDLEFLTKGLHDLESSEMAARLQKIIDAAAAAEQDYEYILLTYALCNNGVVGVRARTKPLVIPKAHDCITMFLGSRKRYQDYFDANPGSYFLTSGWIERDESSEDVKQLSIQHKTGMDMSYEEMVEKFGEENAQYLFETLGGGGQVNNYTRFTYIPMGLKIDNQFEEIARKRAEEKGWDFDMVPGDISLLQRFADGEWDSGEFLIVPPGKEIAASYEEDVLSCKECGKCG